jgi:glycolate oxidase FAD binding subunit
MKNVTGYDLVKLMAGQLGHAGRADGGRLQGAAGDRGARRRADRRAGPHAGGGGDVGGAGLALRGDGRGASAGGGRGAGHDAAARGFAASVAYRTERLRTCWRLSARCGSRPIRSGRGGWAGCAMSTAFAGAGRCLAHLGQAVRRAGYRRAGRGRGAVRLGRRPDLGAGARGDRPARAARRLRGARDAGARLGGDARADGAFQPEPAPIAALSEGLRRQFDPRGILNPGLMGLRTSGRADRKPSCRALSAAVFGGLALMSDRPRGASSRRRLVLGAVLSSWRSGSMRADRRAFRRSGSPPSVSG